MPKSYVKTSRKSSPQGAADVHKASPHIGEALDRLGEALDRLFRIAVGDAVFHAVLDVAFEHDLTALVQRSLCSIDL